MVSEINSRALSWIPEEDIEESALKQIKNVAKMPFIYKHVAVMPDCHYGLGATIGTVLPTLGAVIPAAVGVDVGCGMIAALTSLVRGDLPDDLSPLRKNIERDIPSSIGHNNAEFSETVEDHFHYLKEMAVSTERYHFYNSINKNWAYQLGSLGSGNHFIELVTDELDRVWVFLHSGSRGIGK